MLILLDGLHLYFNFGKIRFINDGFITKKNFGTKKPRNLFLAPSAKTRDRIQKNCPWQKLCWSPLSACKVWWRSINVRRQENEKTRVFLFVTGRNAGIKITFVSLFWFHRPVGATLCTDCRHIWQEGRGRQHLTAKVENSWGSFGEFRPQKTSKKAK